MYLRWPVNRTRRVRNLSCVMQSSFSRTERAKNAPLGGHFEIFLILFLVRCSIHHFMRIIVNDSRFVATSIVCVSLRNSDGRSVENYSTHRACASTLNSVSENKGTERTSGEQKKCHNRWWLARRRKTKLRKLSTRETRNGENVSSAALLARRIQRTWEIPCHTHTRTHYLQQAS